MRISIKAPNGMTTYVQGGSVVGETTDLFTGEPTVMVKASAVAAALRRLGKPEVTRTSKGMMPLGQRRGKT